MLLHKIKALGICGRLGVWLAKFLSDRYQAVACDGHISSKSLVISGVPQGTVLGPILFLILILDISDGVSEGTRVSSFADDTRVSRGMVTTADPIQLQEDLKTIYAWAERVNMSFNGDKFECLRYWPDKDIGDVFRAEFPYKNEEGIEIEEKETLKDLGIQMSADLTFSKHIDKTVTSCRKLTGWILRTFRTRNAKVMLTLWKSMIQSRLDYCSQLWSPHLASDINRLEDIQRKYSASIEGMENLNYRQRLKVLKLNSQERRRDRYTIIFIWKVAMGLTDGYPMEFTSTANRRGRECTVKIVPSSAPNSVKKARENSLAVKGSKMFNLLPSEI